MILSLVEDLLKTFSFSCHLHGIVISRIKLPLLKSLDIKCLFVCCVISIISRRAIDILTKFFGMIEQQIVMKNIFIIYLWFLNEKEDFICLF